MRIRVSHLTTYRYGRPAGSVIQTLRLTPRNHEGQYVAHWRIDVSADCRLVQHEEPDFLAEVWIRTEGRPVSVAQATGLA